MARVSSYSLSRQSGSIWESGANEEATHDRNKRRQASPQQGPKHEHRRVGADTETVRPMTAIQAVIVVGGSLLLLTAMIALMVRANQSKRRYMQRQRHGQLPRPAPALNTLRARISLL